MNCLTSVVTKELQQLNEDVSDEPDNGREQNGEISTSVVAKEVKSSAVTKEVNSEEFVPQVNGCLTDQRGKRQKKRGKFSSKMGRMLKVKKGSGNGGRAKTILSMLIEKNVIQPMETVYYRKKKDGSRMKEGRVTSTGIKCDCCGEIFTLTDFEAHAGSTNHRPSNNIYLEDGRSLFDCQLQVKNDSNLKESWKGSRSCGCDRDIVL